ncbi:MAG: response regulator [Planctomycetota bacterium]
MLVLSRKSGQKVVFPDQGITVEVLRSGAAVTKLGINAPREIRILREELAAKPDSVSPTAGKLRAANGDIDLVGSSDQPESGISRHTFRNELNSLSLALHLFKSEVDQGLHDDADSTFANLIARIERLSQHRESDHQLDVDSRASAMPGQSSARTAGKGRRALLVEDDDSDRQMLATLLTQRGFHVATAADGIEAIEYLHDHDTPEVVLLDMRMPRCDGVELVVRLRNETRFDNMRLIGVSGDEPSSEQLKRMADGINGWVLKPVDPQSLIDAIDLTVPPQMGDHSTSSIAV